MFNFYMLSETINEFTFYIYFRMFKNKKFYIIFKIIIKTKKKVKEKLDCKNSTGRRTNERLQRFTYYVLINCMYPETKSSPINIMV